MSATKKGDGGKPAIKLTSIECKDQGLRDRIDFRTEIGRGQEGQFMKAAVNDKCEEQKSIFDEFRLAKYRITLKAKEHMILPRFKGSMLRGGFGHAFKRICCASREKNCDGCLIRQSCPYAYVFETAPPEGAEHMSAHHKIPHPYIFEPPLDDKTEYGIGGLLDFHLILIGKGIDYLPYFIFAVRELGETGITVRRHKFELISIHVIDCLTDEETLVYSASDNIVHAQKVSLTGLALIDEVEEYNSHQLTLNFLTPTRIKYQGSYCFNEVPMAAIIQNLTLRLNALSYFHGSGIWDDNLKKLKELALDITVIKSYIKKRDVLRYSNRQGKKDSLSGIIGKVSYEGNLELLLPVLFLGQFIHVGSDVVFGCGKYEISYN
ncbi:MAG: CRISPR system precrRNA processing endoribonuclease RAMP protein Cas6 [Actinobacteria bacterium]|nr:CRISPR system precrRNA processing endoribonuclease RAMP protein Cas6 [Actinomycetota bacterium]